MRHDSAVRNPFCYRFTMDGMGRVQKVANMSTGTNLVTYKIGVFRRVGPHMSSFVVSKLANWTIDRRSNVGFAFYDFENAAIKKVAVLIFGIFCTRVFAKGPFRRPLPLRACGPRVLRWKTLRVSSAPHPGGFESHEMGPNKNGPLSRTVSNSVVGDEGCPRAASPPAPRFVAPLLACCAGKRLRVSSAPHPGGFESLCDGPKQKRSPFEDRFQFSGGR